MNKIVIALIIPLVLVLSCSHLKRSDTLPWLQTNAGTERIDISGKWNAGDFFSGGWGKGRLTQEGNSFFGTIGNYGVEGVINNNNVYIIFLSGERVYYTGKLRVTSNGELAGQVVQDAIYGTDKAVNVRRYSLIMDKIID